MKTRFEVQVSDSLPSFDGGWELHERSGSDSYAGISGGEDSASVAG